jgi:hypothetical protein
MAVAMEVIVAEVVMMTMAKTSGPGTRATGREPIAGAETD